MDKDNRRNNWMAPGILSLLLIASLVWGYNQYQIRSEYEIALENHYQRLFYDVKKHVENTQVGISKALVAGSIERNVLLFSEIMSDANFAQDKLGQLPISHSEVANTEKFLSQAADYSYFLIQRHLNGEDITPDQRAALTNLQSSTTAFTNELNTLHDTMASSDWTYGVASTMGFGGSRNEGTTGIGAGLQTSLTNIETGVSDTPELIYDGPFADQTINRKPVGLPNNIVGEEEAKQAAAEFFGADRVLDVEMFEVGEGISESRMPSYTFNVIQNNQQRELGVSMGVSQQGGKVLFMANPRPVGNHEISIEEAEKYALDYLNEKGLDNMQSNYYLQNDGYVIFNMVHTQDGVVVYPDLVKVKVALDNGEVIGFDASPYYMNNKERNFESPAIDENQARQNMRSGFNITSSRLALIPKGSNEVLCYELKGNHAEGEFIIYVNAMNGKEEDILQLIHNENGTLTF